MNPQQNEYGGLSDTKSKMHYINSHVRHVTQYKSSRHNVPLLVEDNKAHQRQ